MYGPVQARVYSYPSNIHVDGICFLSKQIIAQIYI